MAISYEAVRDLTANLYEWSLKKIPEDAKRALETAIEIESNETARKVLSMMRNSAQRAEESDRFVCSDSGVPVYFVKVGTRVQFSGDVKRAISDGFAHLVETIQPPLLKHVTNPLTNERGHAGKDMPIVSWDMLDGADYIDVTCAPKALGSGRWAELKIMSFPTLQEIEEYVLDVVIRTAAQQCPPVTIGVGIGGTFDHCAKLAKMATIRPLGSINPVPELAAMEERLMTAIAKLGYGPMGTGGDTTALAVHVDYASGHGFTPVAVSFNCWISRRTRARLYDDGHVERVE
ncbi:fumarate hydratase [Mangrovibrevibacter kandeliae]|uniref:fumarate hydratase n=1 Tax=Mangrovibrevibacter kandeliae TaxID=2968473 RepID=UPI002117CFBD|nr:MULTISPECIES: fumarate hydratase [unclassified Aurantimonas]MCQ8781880.1 fumarate hydratase [Aurantimonas sp. CSK15Z-1]MCW4115462.1 fumarate hydratase [Aurantimonas sp. MSK8Z-1]